MKIVVALPPNIQELRAAFPALHGNEHRTFFTWGDTIYSPGGDLLTPSLKCHEGIHYQRQTNDTPKIEAWWRSYIEDMEFRLAEEIPAHRAEYNNFVSLERDRGRHAMALHVIATRLCGPLYGSMITHTQAKDLIRGVKR